MRAASILAALLAFAQVAYAVPATVDYEVPTQNCDGTPLALSEITAMEFYFSSDPIPASGDPCASATSPPDVPPTGAVLVNDADLDGTAEVDLPSGTYYVRARVASGEDWSNFSNEVQVRIPKNPRAPIIIRLRF